MSWPGCGCYFCGPLRSLSSLVYNNLFSRTRGVLFYLNFLIHTSSRFSLRNLCSLVTFAVLSYLWCNEPSLLYLSSIGKIENPSCSTCGHPTHNTSHFVEQCPATDSLHRSLFGDSPSLYDFWFRPWKIAWHLCLHDLPPCPHASEGVR